jgi:hypothetical protein
MMKFFFSYVHFLQAICCPPNRMTLPIFFTFVAKAMCILPLPLQQLRFPFIECLGHNISGFFPHIYPGLNYEDRGMIVRVVAP